MVIGSINQYYAKNLDSNKTLVDDNLITSESGAGAVLLVKSCFCDILTFLESSDDGPTSLWINQILGLVVCIICNGLVVVGIRRNSPNYLIPWLAVYIIGRVVH